MRKAAGFTRRWKTISFHSGNGPGKKSDLKDFASNRFCCSGFIMARYIFTLEMLLSLEVFSSTQSFEATKIFV